jgi:hypothetical protein
MSDTITGSGTGSGASSADSHDTKPKDQKKVAEAPLASKEQGPRMTEGQALFAPAIRGMIGAMNQPLPALPSGPADVGKPPSPPKPEDSLKVFGSIAGALGVLLSFKARAPLTASMGALGAASAAMNKRDMDQYAENMKLFQANAKNAIENAKLQSQMFKDSLAEKNLDFNQYQGVVRGIAAAAGYDQKQTQLLLQDKAMALRHADAMMAHADKIKEYNQKLEETASNHIDQMEAKSPIVASMIKPEWRANPLAFQKEIHQAYADSVAGTVGKLGIVGQNWTQTMLKPEAVAQVQRNLATVPKLNAQEQKTLDSKMLLLDHTKRVLEKIEQDPAAVDVAAKAAATVEPLSSYLSGTVDPAEMQKRYTEWSAKSDKALSDYLIAHPEEGMDVGQRARVIMKDTGALALEDAASLGRLNMYVERKLSDWYDIGQGFDTLVGILQSRASSANTDLERYGLGVSNFNDQMKDAYKFINTAPAATVMRARQIEALAKDNPNLSWDQLAKVRDQYFAGQH